MNKKYSKPVIVIKNYTGIDPKLTKDFYLGIGDLISIAIKRKEITGKTTKGCVKKGGEIKKVYKKVSKNLHRVTFVCEFKKDGKKVSENIKDRYEGDHIYIPVSKIDEVIKKLKQIKRLSKNARRTTKK